LPRLINKLVVTDAGPLMALVRQDLLGLLPALFQQVHVPDVVVSECLAHPELPDAQRIKAALSDGWLLAREASPLAMRGLGSGRSRHFGCAGVGQAEGAHGRGQAYRSGHAAGRSFHQPISLAGRFASSRRGATHALSDSLRMELRPFGTEVVTVQRRARAEALASRLQR
jgi:hypothetical protein